MAPISNRLFPFNHMHQTRGPRKSIPHNVCEHGCFCCSRRASTPTAKFRVILHVIPGVHTHTHIYHAATHNRSWIYMRSFLWKFIWNACCMRVWSALALSWAQSYRNLPSSRAQCFFCVKLRASWRTVRRTPKKCGLMHKVSGCNASHPSVKRLSWTCTSPYHTSPHTKKRQNEAKRTLPLRSSRQTRLQP